MAETRQVISTRDGELRIAVRVKPKSSRSKILGLRDGALEIAVNAPPVEGAANEEVVAIVAKTLGVPKSAVQIVTGATGRSKLLGVTGVDLETAMNKLLPGGETA